MTMEAFFSNLIKAKIPTLLLLGIMYYSGITLINKTNNILSIQGVSGGIILCCAGILSIIAFLDYRHKEATDSAISQMDKALTSVSKALTTSANTNAMSEKTRQDTLKSQNESNTIGSSKKRQYSIEENKETSIENS